jgi:hypothetical protein
MKESKTVPKKVESQTNTGVIKDSITLGNSLEVSLLRERIQEEKEFYGGRRTWRSWDRTYYGHMR